MAVSGITFCATGALANQPQPAEARAALPPGYKILATATVSIEPHRIFRILALGRSDEGNRQSGYAPMRPLLVLERKGGRLVEVDRNNHIVMKADEGGQCDPFLDGDAVIATRGRYFTVQNGVACGQHWTNYITFRFDMRAGGFVFDNERIQSWSFNKSSAPDAEALVPDGAPVVTRDQPGHQTPFAKWRPRR